MFTADVELEVAAYLEKSLLLRDIENREKVRLATFSSETLLPLLSVSCLLYQLLTETKRILEIAATVLIVDATAHLCFSLYLRRLLGERRAAVAFLQVNSCN